MQSVLRSRTLRTVLILAVASACMGLATSSAIGDSQSRFAPAKKRPAKKKQAFLYACAHRKTGRLRLVRKPRSCRKTERKVSWPVNAPARGVRGAVGRRGPAGAQGEPGPAGTPARTILTARANAYVGALSPAYAAVTGIMDVTANEALAETLAPAAPFTAGNLAVRLTQAPGAGTAVTVRLRANGADTGLACTVANLATSCKNTSTTATIPAGSAIALQVSSTGVIATISLLVGVEAIAGEELASK
jgi:hypothetical protein